MIRCKDLVKVISSDEPQSLLRKMEIRLHLMMCVHCTNYSKHLGILVDGLRNTLSNRMKAADRNEVSRIAKSALEKLKK